MKANVALSIDSNGTPIHGGRIFGFGKQEVQYTYRFGVEGDFTVIRFGHRG
ncbi:hypothetical protein D1872_300340 [compost metagenome]